MPSPTPPVAVADLKLDLRIDHDEEDGLLARLLDTAIAWIEREIGYVCHARTETFLFDRFDRTLDLPRRPVVPGSVAVGYCDMAGAEQEVADCRVLPIGGWVRVAPPALGAWPLAADVPGAISVTATIGLADATTLPADLKGALRMIVGALYRNRDCGELPEAALQLLDRWRRKGV